MTRFAKIVQYNFMLEAEPDRSKDIELLSTQNRVFRFAGQSADRNSLNLLARDGLFKYARLSYLIEDIRFLFHGTTMQYAFYPVEENEDGELTGELVSRDDYSERMKYLSLLASNVYNDYLNGSENARLAAREVKNFILDRYPKFPPLEK